MFGLRPWLFKLACMMDAIVVTDEQLDRKVREIVDQLRRVLRESAVVAHDLRTCRVALARVGAQAQEMVLADDGSLSCGGTAVEPWPTDEEVRRLLRLDWQLCERMALLRGDLRRMGIGPELFE